MVIAVTRASEQPINIEDSLNPFQSTCSRALSSVATSHRDLNTPYVFKNPNWIADQQYIGQPQVNGNASAESYANSTLTAISNNSPILANIPDSQAPYSTPCRSLCIVPPLRSNYMNSPSPVCSNYKSASTSDNVIGQALTSIRSNDVSQQMDSAKGPLQDLKHHALSSVGYNPLNSNLSTGLTVSHTLPKLSSLLANGAPPGPRSMMGQFSSKRSSGIQKKHRCRVCDKCFIRPSAFQIHLYSHSGEKPFPCEFKDCGKQFFVVSNLRRHRRVHKGLGFEAHSKS